MTDYEILSIMIMMLTLGSGLIIEIIRSIKK